VPFDWRAYFDLAKELQGQASEAAQRSSISRAYYAVFGTAKNHLKTKGVIFANTGEKHMLVWNRFLNSRAPCREIGSLGDRLRRRRLMADYANITQHVEKEAENAIQDATEFFELLAQRPNCP
jgi:uncharacterized protein (UPF0332 family)